MRGEVLPGRPAGGPAHAGDPPGAAAGAPAQSVAVKPMRILVVIDGNYPSTGGAEIQAGLLARVFAAAGHRVETLAPRLDPSRPLQQTHDGIPHTRIGFPRIRLLGAAILCLKFAAWLWRRRNEVDAIHVHMAKNLAAVCGLLRPFLRATLTVKISGAWEFQGGILDPRLRDRPLFRFYNRCIRRADCIQSISRFTYAQLRDAGYPESVLRLIPNAVDLARFSPRPEGRSGAGTRPHVVFVGRIVPLKGLADLVDAWAAGNLATHASLTIAGDGPQRAALMRQARQKGVHESITFAGELANVETLLADADVYVQPSHQEGLSNAVLEAMATGLPIVATRISGNEDVVTDGDNGMLVPPGNAAALAEALLQMVEQPALARRMGARSRALVEARFSTRAVTAQLERAYRGLPAIRDTPD